MYKKMYLILFNAILDSLKERDVDKIKAILIDAQQEAEEVCMDSDEEI